MNKKLTTILIVVSFIGLGFYFWGKYRGEKNLDPNKLQEPLKSFYFKLKEKEYNPKTNPLTHPNAFVTFSIGKGNDEIQVSVNHLNMVLVYANNKSYTPIKYSGEDFTVNNKILSDKSDLFDGVLEIIENKSYEI
jgi:hypothetical protein